MVHFVKPNLLGKLKEFTNRFMNPINNGQYHDSTIHDINLMRKRSHVLNRLLSRTMQVFTHTFHQILTFNGITHFVYRDMKNLN